jgi:Flp pilus assembly protein TadG
MTSPRQRSRGLAALEFALLLIPLLVVLAGITEVGRAMYYYNTLAKSARDAARLMSTQAPSDPDYAALASAASCGAIYGNNGCSGAPLLPGLATSMVSMCDPQSCAATHANVATGSGVVNLVTVTIGGPGNPYTFVPRAPFIPGLFGVAGFDFGPIHMTLRQVL